MGVADLKGNLYLTDTYEKNGEIIDIASRDYYKESIQGKIGIMDTTVSINPDDNGALIMVYSVPIKNKDDIVGILVAIGDGSQKVVCSTNKIEETSNTRTSRDYWTI